MALGFASAEADNILNAWGRNVSYAGNAAVYMKLHTASPGTGSTAAAGNTTRQQVSFSASSGGTMANSGAVTWSNVSTSETYTHFSLWTASSSGTFLGSGSFTSSATVTAGDTFSIAISGFTASVSVAA